MKTSWLAPLIAWALVSAAASRCAGEEPRPSAAAPNATPLRAAESPTSAAESRGSPQAASEIRAFRPKKPSAKVTIAKETTYLTEPLRCDGYVDYAAALNQQCSEGVTPENNAVVLLWQAFDSSEIANRDEYFRLLGVPPPPEEGAYFETRSEYIDRWLARQPIAPDERDKLRADADRQFDRALARPWRHDECPLVADWLAANEAPLALLAEASRRPRYFSPLLDAEDAPMLFGEVDVGRLFLEAGLALQTRTMQQRHKRKFDSFPEDIRVCYRFARLVDQSPTPRGHLTSRCIDLVTNECLLAVAYFTSPSAEQVHGVDAEFATLRRMRPISDYLDRGERFLCLDTIAAGARRGISKLERRDIDHPKAAMDIQTAFANLALDASMDWDESLRGCNQWCDRIVAAGQQPTLLEQAAALENLNRDALDFEQTYTDFRKTIALAKSCGFRTAMGRQCARGLVSLRMPIVRMMFHLEGQTQVRRDEVHIALMLEAWRADHDGAYPKELDDLAPEYLSGVPSDPWSGLHYRYRMENREYVLYSIGPNHKDDQGLCREPDFAASDNDAEDDIAIMPPEIPEK